MPAGSDEVALPHTWRPLGPRIAGIGAGFLLLFILLATWVLLPQEIRDQFTVFQRVTLLVIIGLAGAAFHALVRSRVVASQEGLLVVNGYKSRSFEWAQVVAVHLPPGAPWAVLDLDDGETCAAMGIQGSDGARAQRAVRQLRALLP